jgi:hypothetical protein
MSPTVLQRNAARIRFAADARDNIGAGANLGRRMYNLKRSPEFDNEVTSRLPVAE